MEFVCIDELVPSDHLLRKVDKHIDFSFIHDLVKDLYCADNGRPALDPTLLFKMLLVGYLFGVRSERQLVREVQVNVAYRWFLGLNLTDKIPDPKLQGSNRSYLVVASLLQEFIPKVCPQSRVNVLVFV